MKKRVPQSETFIDVEQSVKDIPKEISDYVQMSRAVSKYIADFTESQEYKQIDIALKLGKTAPEISKWLSGFHNLTLSSMIKLQSACSIELLNPAIFSSSTKEEKKTVASNPENFFNQEYLHSFIDQGVEVSHAGTKTITKATNSTEIFQAA